MNEEKGIHSQIPQLRKETYPTRTPLHQLMNGCGNNVNKKIKVQPIRIHPN